MKLNDATLISLGGTPAKAVYLGSTLVWSATPPDPKGFTAFYEAGEATGSNQPTWWILIKGTAAADYALMFRPGPSPTNEAGYPSIAPSTGTTQPYPALTPVMLNGAIAQQTRPVYITAGMTAKQIGDAIKQAWNGVESTPGTGAPVPLSVSIFPANPVFLSRMPARVRAAFGNFDLTQDVVVTFKPVSPLHGSDYFFIHFSPLVAWRKDAGGHWIEYQPNAGTQASGTVVYIDTTGGAVPDPNNVPAGMGAVPVGMKWTWTDAGGQPLAGANMDVEILFGPDANSLTPVGPFTATLDGNGEYQFNTDIDKGPGRYEYRGKIGSTVVTQVFIGV